MPLVTAGAVALAALAIADGFTSYANANAHLGVGDSSTAFNVSQTDLVAASNKLRKAMDATYPQRSSGVLTFRSTFGTSDANYAWAEIGVFNASSSGTMLCRVVQSHGTKASGDTWVLTHQVTVSA